MPTKNKILVPTLILILFVLLFGLYYLYSAKINPLPNNTNIEVNNITPDERVTYKSLISPDVGYENFYLTLTITDEEYIYAVGDCNGTSHKMFVSKGTNEAKISTYPTTRMGCPEEPSGYGSDTIKEIREYFRSQNVEAPRVEFEGDDAFVYFKNEGGAFFRLIKEPRAN